MEVVADYQPSFILVDDDEDDRLLMRMALAQTAHTLPVVELGDGTELIAYLETELSKKRSEKVMWLIIMDVNMPLMSGPQALQIMRQHLLWKEIPVMIMSTSDDPYQIKDVLAKGASAYVVKSKTYTGLVDQIQTTFKPWLMAPELVES